MAEIPPEFEDLTRAVNREHERAAHREQIIDRLHEENQRLRHGLLEEAMVPVRNTLYRLHDTAAREAARWQGAEPPPPAQAGALFEMFAEEIAEALGRTGLEPLAVKVGDAYDAARHRPAETRPVEPERDGTVVAVLSSGFTTGERVTRKAVVAIGRAAATDDGGE